MNGAGHGVRTRDIQLGKLNAASHNQHNDNTLQIDSPVASTPASTLSPNNAPDSAHADTLNVETIVVAIRNLTPEDRERLAAALER